MGLGVIMVFLLKNSLEFHKLRKKMKADQDIGNSGGAVFKPAPKYYFHALLVLLRDISLALIPSRGNHS
jgi:hypothetical protein